MSLCSLSFLFFCMVVVIVFHLAGGKRWRQLILAAANAAFLFTFVEHLRTWAFFAAVLGATYLALVLVRLSHRGAVVAAGIALAVCVFLWFKRFDIVTGLFRVPYDWDLSRHPVELVGLSYMMVKLIHMLVDEWQGQLAPFNLWSYLNYQLALFTLTAGPIQRYNDFQRTWQGTDLGPTDTRDAILLWCRILVGLLKIRVVGGWGESTHLRGTNDLTGVLFAFYGYPLYLYLNFSGYTDVMIGLGGLLGFKVPENFNHPYLARNVLDFWDRWHISFSHWIRDYVFMSSYKAAATNFPRAARYWGYGLLFVALFLAGVWHGTTNGFVAFGVLNGAGAAATRAYGDGLRRMFGAKGLHAYLQNRFIRWIAILVTLHYTCLSMLFFSRNYDPALAALATGWREILKLPASYGSQVWVSQGAGWLAIAALILAGLWNSDAIGSGIARVARGAAARRGVLCLSLFTVTAVAVSVLFFDWAFQQVPSPVRYMAF